MGNQPLSTGIPVRYSHAKKWNRDTTFYLLLILKTYETATFTLLKCQSPHTFLLLIRYPH